MNSYELSRNWFDWCFENPEKITPNHTAIYFFAVEHCNRLGWKEKFGFPTQMAMEAIGIKKHQTYIKYFNDLVDWGFFKLVQKSQNQYSANIISINFAMPKNGKALGKAIINHTAKQTETTGQSNSSINKPITINNKQDNHKQIFLAEPNRDLKFVSKFIREEKPKFLEPYVECWNMFAEKYNKPKIIELSESRKKKLIGRLRNENFIFPDILNKVKDQSFPMENSWFTFDWILENDKNYLKILEGNYKDKPKEPKQEIILPYHKKQ